MVSTRTVAAALGLAYGLTLSLAGSAQQGPSDAPRYVNGTSLVRPADYREWIFLSSGLDMVYNPPPAAATAPERHTFTNVFVNPTAYRSFMQTGAWPNGTVFVLEARRGESEGSINKAGQFQAAFAGLEAHVKDSQFPGGWAFFAGVPGAAWPPLAGDRVAACNDCHTKNGAVDQTFVQFYPTLLDVARQKGTLRPGF
jgi:hypothetical protein